MVRRWHLLPIVLFAISCGESTRSGEELSRVGRMVVGDHPVEAATEREAAETFLDDNRRELGLDGIDLVLEHERQGRAGTYFRYGQRANDVVVFDGQVIVLVDPRRHVRVVNLAHRRVPAPSTTGVVDETTALATAGAEHGKGTAVLGIDHDGALVYHVSVSAHDGDWLVVVDAHTGRQRAKRDLRRYVFGTGYVFDPDPVSSSGNTALADNNDATDAALDAARFQVNLPRLFGGTGFLIGQWVDARPKTVNKRADEPTRIYMYDRADVDGHFEEVNAYFHLDRAQDRIQVLGFSNVNNRIQVANVNDTHLDNSFYNPQDKELTFGTGGVDDAEDADVILHEYGHSIQDNQVPGYGGGDEGAMGEGFGDYFAASFNKTLSQQVSDEYCLADWDAVTYDTNTPPCLRRLDSPRHWPEHKLDEIHDDGIMWATALYRGRSLVGADVMDSVVLESHFLLSTDETVAAAANAVLAADDTLYFGQHRVALRRAFIWQGLLTTLSAPSSLPDVLSSENVTIANARTSNLYADSISDLQTYTKAGAQALRIHFATIDTQPGDNIYLYNGLGDLFQILTGASTDTLSVVIPGDTVQIRLVTDGTTQGFGFTIDRIDSIGVFIPPDAALPDAPLPDAAVPDAPAIDAATPDAPPDAATPDAPAIDAAAPDAATPDAPAIDAAAPDAPPDASAPDAAAPDAAAPDAAAPDARAIDAAVTTPDAPTTSGDDSGCGCHTGTNSSSSLGGMLLVGYAIMRRRRRLIA